MQNGARSRSRWTARFALALLVLWVASAAVCPSCVPGTRGDEAEVIIPEIGIRLQAGDEFVAPADGWFLSDAELKRLFMDEYESSSEIGDKP